MGVLGSPRQVWRRTLLVSALASGGIGADAAAQTLLIGNKGEDTVSFVDLASGRERVRVVTGEAPHEIAVSPDGRRAAVVAYGGSSIDIFDVGKARLVMRLDIAPNAGPHGIIWPGKNLLIAVAERSRTLVLLDPRRGVLRSIATGQPGSHMLALSPDRRTAYVANILGGTVTIVDLERNRKVRDIAVGGYPEGIAITRDGRELWVGDDSSPRLRVVDIATGRTVATLATDSIPIRVAISPDGRTAITSNMATGTLNLFNVATRRPIKLIRVSGDAGAMQVTIAFALDGRSLFVAETGKDTVAEVDLATGTVLRRIQAGKNGDGLGVAP